MEGKTFDVVLSVGAFLVVAGVLVAGPGCLLVIDDGEFHLCLEGSDSVCEFERTEEVKSEE